MVVVSDLFSLSLVEILWDSHCPNDDVGKIWDNLPTAYLFDTHTKLIFGLTLLCNGLTNNVWPSTFGGLAYDIDAKRE